MFFVDVLAFTLLWVIWHEVSETLAEIDSRADSIKFYGNLFFLLIISVGPVLHVLTTIEFLRPGTWKKTVIKGIDVNRFVLIFLGLLITLSFFLKHSFINHIENSGYVHCAEKSKWASFSKEHVFVRSSPECGAEEENRE